MSCICQLFICMKGFCLPLVVYCPVLWGTSFSLALRNIFLSSMGYSNLLDNDKL